MLSVWIFYNERSNLADLELKDLSAKSNLIVESITPVISSIFYWSQYDFLEADFIPGSNSKFEEKLGNFMVGTNQFSQFRLIDIDGNEVFRIDRTDDGIQTRKDLQNKSKNGYFQKTIALDSGALYVSPLNLNNEFGKVEKPYKPVIRGSAPLFSGNGHRLGIVVINYDAKELLKSLNQELTSNFYVIDNEANYLSNSLDRSREFEKFITPDKAVGFDIDHPETWNLLKTNQKVINDDEGFWVAERLDFEEATSNLNLVKDGYAHIETENSWFLISKISNATVFAAAKNFYISLLFINFIFLLIILYVSNRETKNELIKLQYLQELKEKKNKLENQNILLSSIQNKLQLRNRQLKEYNSIVAHNLRAPTTSMSALVSMVSGSEDYDELKTYIPKLNTITSSINTLVKDLLVYVRVLNDDQVKTEKIHVEPLIRDCLGLYLEILDQTVQVELDFSSWKTIKFSKIYLQSIIQNLISNAIKYRDPAKKSCIKISTSINETERILIIEDNGLGIDLDRYDDDMFKLYKRFHRNVSGRGMGLFLVKTQLESLNAGIQVKSKPGVGTKFILTFSQNNIHHDILPN
ncbi:signal transduction histidine kinase [Gramella sp. Hel_I_59]|uniref:sensor histidine kinase n=1 Tax=Gramella sp. Hel_I_59 TaxID=1249978 RepID=UPI001153D33F|nr:ATP-binding protein [Gramella sp. Hel_I_59]TQI71326.1 signal transduction histidine kinase [Gramella sp. Hel_I_59]